MKKRAVSFLLAVLMLSSLAIPAFAVDTSDEVPAEDVTEEVTEDTVQETDIEEEAVQSPIYLDGEPAALEYEFIDNVCYVTVRSFLALMDPEAMVEEENGTVTVSAVTVTGVVDVEDGSEKSAEDETDAAENEPDEAAPAEADVEIETLSFTAGAGVSYVVANGRYLYVANGIRLVEGAIAAPIRVMAEVFNLNVYYDGSTGSVLLSQQEGADAYLLPGDAYYNSDTLYWLSHIIQAESGNQPLEGMIAVANVVLNRVAHPSFPDNVYDVLFQVNQFTPAITGSIYQDANEICYIAAMLAMDGANVVPGALFFNRAGMACYASRNKTFIATIGGHSFYG